MWGEFTPHARDAAWLSRHITEVMGFVLNIPDYNAGDQSLQPVTRLFITRNNRLFLNNTK